MVRVWRDRGIARRLISVRDNEVAAGSAGIPVVRTKLMAFALSGFMAGYAGVCLAFATERFSTDTFDPTVSILVVSMVVIGGLDAIPGAVLGALYLVGLPAIFGSSTTVQFLTSGVGLMAFILYLPGGMAQVMHQLGDLATAGVVHLRARWRGEPPADPDGRSRPRVAAAPGRTAPAGAVAEVDLVTTPDATDPTTTDAGTITDDDGPSRPPRQQDEKGRPRPPRHHRPGGVVRWAAGRGRGQRGGRAGHDRGAHRAQRVGQDHAARHGVGAGGTGGGIADARR